ncbi:hypothetical protein BJ085DRAFT_37487 [Dimargaris cristalligena]|uniref:Uncharacterized protein n=1 Tax=Dimargaris cristalligena TaxID=215637 RepID=A0A4Q0A2X1_9FUNG|nr:hypothetical protein BJ085DRAFT_37487 [Dimargaris cristalligena]|eukprot:RKP40444.1 hypothetical protein BJ085DRAFT_37487 [Dimargaris cristalligena]
MPPVLTDHGFNEIRHLVYLPILFSYTVFHITTSTLYYFRVLPGTKMPRYITIINHTAALGLGITMCLSNAYRFQFSCSINLWAYYLFVLSWWITFLARTAHLSFLAQASHAKLHVPGIRTHREEAGPAAAMEEAFRCAGPADGKGKGKGSGNENGYGYGKTGAQPRPAGFHRVLTALARRYTWSRLRKLLAEPSLLRITGVATLIVVIYCTVVQLASPHFRASPDGDVGCGPVAEFLPLYLALGFLVLVVCPFIVYCLRPIRDAYGLKRDLTITVVVCFVGFLLFMFMDMALDHYVEYFGGSVFLLLGFFIIQVTTVVMPVLQTFRQGNVGGPLPPAPSAAAAATTAVASKGGPPTPTLPPLPLPFSPLSHPSEWFTRHRTSPRPYTWDDFLLVVGSTERCGQLKQWATMSFCNELVMFLEDYQRFKMHIFRVLQLPILPAATTVPESITVSLGTLNGGKGNTGGGSGGSSSSSSSSRRSEDDLWPSSRPSTSNDPLSLMELPTPAYQTILESLQANQTWLNDPSMTLPNLSQVTLKMPVTATITTNLSSKTSSPASSLAEKLGSDALNYRALSPSHSSTSLSRMLTTNEDGPTMVPLDCQVMARNLFRRYMVSTSDMVLNITGSLQDAITAEINAERFSVEIFDQAHQEVLRMLYLNVFPKYWNSPTGN